MRVTLASPAGARRRPPWSASIGRPLRPEDAIQRALLDHLRARGAPGLVAWHTLNGGQRNRIEAAILKGHGVHRPGVSDVIAVTGGRIFALELKAEDGRPTEAQLQSTADMEAAGAFICIAHGLHQALAVLESWGLLREHAS
jgi:hypothetical protein